MEVLRRGIHLPSIIAWCLYDWACAAFSIIVTTYIFATYFTSKIAVNEIIGTYQWANATSIAGVIIALTSPMFGAIADKGGNHKWWLFCFTSISVISCILLWFAYPQQSSVSLTLVCLVIGTVGLEIAIVFYNSFLPKLTPTDHIGRVSGWGWGSGYIGGMIALFLVLIIFVKYNIFGLDEATAAQIRICGPFTALWYGLFSLPFFLLVPNTDVDAKPLKEAIRSGAKELFNTIKKLPKEKNILIYLIAHMIYTDGLNTLFIFGGIYAAGTLNLSLQEVLLFGVTMNITAGIGAFALGWLDDYFGSKEVVLFSLICLTIFGIPLILLHQKVYFWTLALILAIFVGPVQAGSRSLMVRLIEKKETAAEMFALYALSGRITAFIGPWLFGINTYYFDTQRAGMATVIAFLFLGALLLIPVKVKKELNG